MSAACSIGELFEPPPTGWGLRGDPHLWRELQSLLASRELPADECTLSAQLFAAIEQLTGTSINAEQNSYVARYATGGMSSGRVSHAFWRERGIPLLLERATQRAAASRD